MTAGPQKGGKVRRTAPTTPPPTAAPAPDAAPTGAAIASSRLARSLGVVGALAMFLAVGIVPWVTTADSDSRTWYSFFQVVTYPDRGAVDVAGWVTGLVVCAAIAAVILVLFATQIRAVASGTRVSAVVASVLIAALGFAVAHSFTDGDDALHLGRAVAVRARRGAGESRAAQALDRQGPSPEQVTSPGVRDSVPHPPRCELES